MSDTTSERSLADDDTQDVTSDRPDLTTDEVLAGFRAQRRAVKLRPNAHLLADMQQLVDQIDEAPQGADVDALIDQYEGLRGRFEQVEWWVVEQRTEERRQKIREDAAKALGYEHVDGNPRGLIVDDPGRVKEQKVETHVIVDHIVSPEGVTADDIWSMYQQSVGEWSKVERSIVQVQRILDDAAAGEVLRDFSSRRSGTSRRS